MLLEGLQKLAANPDVMKLSDELRGQLLTAARSAATKGLTDQLTAFADTLNKQAELARQTGEVVEGTVEDVGDTAGDTVDGVSDAAGGTVEGVSDTAGTVGETAGDTVSGAGSAVGGALGVDADEDDEAEDDEAEDEGERAETSQDDEPEASDDTDEPEASADTDGSEQDDQSPQDPQAGRAPFANRGREQERDQDRAEEAGQQVQLHRVGEEAGPRPFGQRLQPVSRRVEGPTDPRPARGAIREQCVPRGRRGPPGPSPPALRCRAALT